MFSQDQLTVFKRFLDYGRATKEVEAGNHHFMVLSRMMGHSSIDVTHSHYIHCQSAITRYHLNILATDQHQSDQFDIKNRA